MEYLREKHILIVDDEPDIRELLAEEVGELGAQVSVAKNAEDAISQMKTSSFAAVVSDIRMPGGGGRALLKEARSLGTSLPVFFLMTGFSDLRLDEALDLGAEAVFKKPLNIEALLYSLNQSLQPRDQRWTRANLRLPVTLEIQLQYSQNERRQEHTANIGRGGLFVRIENSPLPDIHHRIGFEMKLTHFGRIKGVGLVRWVRRVPDNELAKGFGMEFEGLENDSKRKLLEFLNETQTKSYIPIN